MQLAEDRVFIFSRFILKGNYRKQKEKNAQKNPKRQRKRINVFERLRGIGFFKKFTQTKLRRHFVKHQCFDGTAIVTNRLKNSFCTSQMR